MHEAQPHCMQGDSLGKRQAGSVAAITGDRAAAARQLHPQLVPATCRWHQFHERHLPHAAHDPGPHVGGPRRGLGRSSSLVLGMPLDEVVPLDPLAQRRRKPTLDDGDVFLRDGVLPKLLGERGGGRPGFRKHQHARDRCVETAHDAQKPAARAALLDE